MARTSTTRLASSVVDADLHSFPSILSTLTAKLPSLFPRPTEPPPSISVTSILSSCFRTPAEVTSSYPDETSWPDESIPLLPRVFPMKPKYNLLPFNLLLNRLARRKLYSEIFCLYGEMKSIGRVPDLFTLNILLYCFCDTNRVRQGLVVVGQILRSGYSPNIKTLNSLILGLFRGGRSVDAVELFLKLEKYGCCPDAITWRSLIGGLCRSGHTIDALRIHEQIVSGKGGQYGLGSNVSYGCIIDDLCKGGMVGTARKLFLEMKGKGLSPNVIHYNALMKGFCCVGKLKQVMSLFGEMLDVGIRPNGVTFSVLTDVFRKAGNTKEGNKRLLEMMIDKGENLDNVVYATFMNKLCFLGNLSDPLELFESLPNKGCEHNDAIGYTVLIDGYCKHGRIEEALNLYHQMLQKQIKPNRIAYNTLLSELFLAGKVEDSKKLLESILADDDNLGPDVSTFCICIDGFCKNNRTLEAMEFLHKIESSNFELNIKIFNCMIYWLCKSRKLEASWKLFNSLSEKCVKPDLVTYTILMRGMCKEGQVEKVNDLFLKMENQGCSPPIINYNTILRCFVENDQFEKVVEVLCKMVEKKVSPDVWTRFLVFDVLLKDGKYDDRLHLLPTFPSAEECDTKSQQGYENLLWLCDATLFGNERQRRLGSMGYLHLE